MSYEHKIVDKNSLISVHSSMKFSLTLLQICGFFPVSGICKSSCTTLKFSWLSFRTFYSVFWFICMSLVASVETYKVFFVDQSEGQTSEFSQLCCKDKCLQSVF